MTYRWNENDLGLEGVEGWAHWHDGEITSFGITLPVPMPCWLARAIEDAFEIALPDLVEARQRGEAAERDDAEYHEQAEAMK